MSWFVHCTSRQTLLAANKKKMLLIANIQERKDNTLIARARSRSKCCVVVALLFGCRCVAVLIYYRLAKYCFELLKFPIDLFALMLSTYNMSASGMPAYEPK